MPDHTYPERARALLHGLAPKVEKIAQDAAGTEAVLHATATPDEARATMRLEYELQREVECWEAIRAAIDERIAPLTAMLAEQREKRAAGQ